VVPLHYFGTYRDRIMALPLKSKCRLEAFLFAGGKVRFGLISGHPAAGGGYMRMRVSVEFADAGTMTGKHSVLVVGGCSDITEPGDIGISLEEAKTLLRALQCEYVAAQAA
jgi:hypothetical protein